MYESESVRIHNFHAWFSIYIIYHEQHGVRQWMFAVFRAFDSFYKFLRFSTLFKNTTTTQTLKPIKKCFVMMKMI